MVSKKQQRKEKLDEIYSILPTKSSFEEKLYNFVIDKSKSNTTRLYEIEESAKTRDESKTILAAIYEHSLLNVANQKGINRQERQQKATQLYTEAADNGYVPAAYRLAKAYENGTLPEKGVDLNKAAQYYSKCLYSRQTPISTTKQDEIRKTLDSDKFFMRKASDGTYSVKAFRSYRGYSNEQNNTEQTIREKVLDEAFQTLYDEKLPRKLKLPENNREETLYNNLILPATKGSLSPQIEKRLRYEAPSLSSALKIAADKDHNSELFNTACKTASRSRYRDYTGEYISPGIEEGVVITAKRKLLEVKEEFEQSIKRQKDTSSLSKQESINTDWQTRVAQRETKSMCVIS